MKAYLDCYPCFFIQTLRTMRLITSDEKEIWKALREVSSFLPQLSFDSTPPEIGREVYRIISEITGVEDPYQEIKKTCTQKALDLYPEVKEKVKKADNPLMAALRAAIAGNIIDFGANTEFDIEKDLEKIFVQDFAVNHFHEFKQMIRKADQIVYLADNAGETVFDRILIEELDVPVIYAVRDKPVINDAVKEEAVAAGLDRIAVIISSGSDAPGTVLNCCSKEFLDTFNKAPMIISKGQGNYEALSELKKPIFFLLKAKCPVIAEDIGVPEGSIILMESNIYSHHREENKRDINKEE
ncbi:MAG TPA: ARMT1-like domain-containing protein [Acidobacteriota bacterium]|nr:ARMT1-like domain-containing protein [Acidobacteriota bacterium]